MSRKATTEEKSSQAAFVEDVREILRDALQIGERADALHAASPLFGAIPELDSMAVVTVLTMVEEQFGITIDDDDVSVKVFATVGALSAFISQKVGD